MGEPLLHPCLEDILSIAKERGLNVCLTTNGTLLSQSEDVIRPHLSSIHKISISLQAMEANPGLDENKYLAECFEFGKKFEGKTIIVYRLWNEGGANKNNPVILNKMQEAFPSEWKDHPLGKKIGNKLYLETGEKFDWPDYESDLTGDENSRYYCYGLSDHIGILSDGTVVPCCLDSEGSLSLGNIFSQNLEQILQNERSVHIANAFKEGRAFEELCRRCGYAQRFVK